MQLVLCLEEKEDKVLNLQINSDYITCRGALIKSKTPHNFYGQDIKHAIILIDHTSQLGRCLERHYLPDHAAYCLIPEPLACALSQLLLRIPKKSITALQYHDIWHEFLSLLDLAYCATDHVIADQRIFEIIEKIKISGDFNYSMSDLANQWHLSPSRLSHLFKTHTGGTLKSYLLFKQLLNALYLIAQGSSATDAAMSSGFDSSSHLSSTCRRLTGIHPHRVSKVSNFLKVSLFH